MNRVSCVRCGKQFKRQSGLDYHVGWAHKSTGEDTAAETEEDWLSGLFAGDSSEDNAKDVASLALQRLPSQPEQARLLKQIQHELERLEGHSLDGTGTFHPVDSDCATCYEMLHDIGWQGMLTGAKAIFSIPGVREAVAFNEWARAKVAEIPGIDDDIVTNWVEIPGIQDIIRDYDSDAKFWRDLLQPVEEDSGTDSLDLKGLGLD